MRVFILEDDFERNLSFGQALRVLKGSGHDVTIKTNVKEAIRVFQPPYDLILLDHDLGGEQMVDSRNINTGAEFCRWLVLTHPDLDSRIIVHSYNPDGAKYMMETLRELGGVNAIRTPFGSSLLAYLKGLKV